MEGKPNMAIIYPESHIECRDSDFDGQINDKNLKTALGINIGFEFKNWLSIRMHGGTLKQS